MPFQKLQVPKYPRRLWEIVGRAGSGKSTFLTRMRSPILPIDADHRIDEVARLNPDMLALSNTAEDHNTPDRIAHLLHENMPGSKVGTIAVDSLTAIIAPRVTQAMIDRDEGRTRNLYAGFRDKALAMRQLQDAITMWGTDVLWIYHIDDARDADGKLHTKATISTTELARLMRSVNLKLEVVIEKNRRGIKVKWARRGRSGDQVGVLWDETGDWRGMPERIESVVYDGLTEEQQAQIENALPESFPDDATAIGWGLEQGAFNELTHARNAYEKLMREHGDPEDMDEKAALWIGDVLARLEERTHGQGNGNGAHKDAPAASAPAKPVGPTEFWERANALEMRGVAQDIYKKHTVGKQTDWAAALANLEKVAAEH